MTMHWLICICFVMAASLSSASGVWTGGGGGEILQDAQNPWFVQNTESVRYCIITDSRVFLHAGSNAKDLDEYIKLAVNYWKHEFSNAFTVANLVRVATQNFHLVKVIDVADEPHESCPLTTDLTFQFGVLEEAQIKNIKAHGKDAKQLIAVAIRKSYNRESLHGKGYIYVAPFSGPLRPIGPNLLDQPWTENSGNLLIRALVHELGHVFGLGHLGSVMQADYLERITNKNFSWISENRIEPFFMITAPLTLRSQCFQDSDQFKFRKGWVQLLDIPSQHLCYVYKLVKDRILFFTGTSMTSMDLRGEMIFKGKETFSWQIAGQLFLPKEEKVYGKIDPSKGGGARPWLLGPMIKNSERFGIYRSADGKTEHRMFVRFLPMGVGFSTAMFSVEMGDTWHWNLDFEY